MNEIIGNVFDIQRFSLHDGPGIRTTVFLKGCPLHCAWCHNPEGLRPEPQILFRPERCIGCGDCGICPNDAHSLKDGLHRFERSRCIGCGQCAETCPANALTLTGKSMRVTDVMALVRADARYYENDGGVTLSGGEPAMQPDFSHALLKSAKEEGFHTAVETSGCVDFERLRPLLPVTDLFLFDWKHSDAEQLMRYTGASLERIRANLLTLDQLGAQIILRCPMIPGVNDVREHFNGIIEIAKSLRGCQAIHLEPYHAMGLSKAAQLGVKHSFTPSTPTAESMEKMRQNLSQCLAVPVMIS